jgi:hypothetical protein
LMSLVNRPIVVLYFKPKALGVFNNSGP